MRSFPYSEKLLLKEKELFVNYSAQTSGGFNGFIHNYWKRYSQIKKARMPYLKGLQLFDINRVQDYSFYLQVIHKLFPASGEIFLSAS